MARKRGFPELVDTLKNELGSYRKVGNALGCGHGNVGRLLDGSGGLDRDNIANLVFLGFNRLEEILTGKREGGDLPSEQLGDALIIEDSAESGAATRDYLTFLGFTTRWVETYRDAVRELSGPTDWKVVVADNRLPDGSGVLLLKNRELLQGRPSPPFLLITAYDEADLIEGELLGANSTMKKPFSLSDLELKVKGMLAQAARLKSK